MNEHPQLIRLLNDLIRINCDRVDGYKKAIDELKPSDIDLRTMFTNMVNHSTQFMTELKQEVVKLGGRPAEDATDPGKVYHLWMEVRAAVSNHDRKSIVALCEFWEDAALKSYDAALANDSHLPAEAHQMLTNQRSSIKSSHDVVKRYRDMHEAVSH
ncbi:MAG TPA: PA2169 family four-helix-bundle protein [Chryseosolibacter sp.]|nr:PA2169 family four-helix-bundle protein [Chryseosolibacter sp.]